MRVLRQCRCVLWFGGLLFTLLAFAPASAQQRPMTPDDVLRLEELGDVAFSPDGAWLAYVVKRAKTVTYHKWDFLWGNDRADIWLVPPSGGTPKNLTNGASDGSGFWLPVWSPQGNWLAMLSTRGGNVRLWVWDRVVWKPEAPDRARSGHLGSWRQGPGLGLRPRARLPGAARRGTTALHDHRGRSGRESDARMAEGVEGRRDDRQRARERRAGGRQQTASEPAALDRRGYRCAENRGRGGELPRPSPVAGQTSSRFPRAGGTDAARSQEGSFPPARGSSSPSLS